MREVRFFPDYGARWCLWEAGTENGTPFATELGASREVEARIGAWYDFWETHCPVFVGWDHETNLRAWRKEGHEIVAELRSELDGLDIDIVPQFG